MFQHALTKSWVGVNKIFTKDIKELSVPTSPVNIFQVEPLEGDFQHYARLFPTLKGPQEILISPLKIKTTGLTLLIYMKDPPDPFGSGGSVARGRRWRMKILQHLI